MTLADIEFEIGTMLALQPDELTDEMRNQMDAYLNELAGQEAEKIDATSRLLQNWRAMAQAKREEARRLFAAAQQLENTAERLKEHYIHILRDNGLSRVAGNIYTMSVRKTDVVVIDDEAALDEKYIKTEIKKSPVKADIKAAIKAGASVAGAHIEKSESLQVK